MDEIWSRVADLAAQATTVTVYELEKEIFKLCLESYGKGYHDAKQIPVHIETTT